MSNNFWHFFTFTFFHYEYIPEIIALCLKTILKLWALTRIFRTIICRANHLNVTRAIVYFTLAIYNSNLAWYNNIFLLENLDSLYARHHLLNAFSSEILHNFSRDSGFCLMKEMRPTLHLTPFNQYQNLEGEKKLWKM